MTAEISEATVRPRPLVRRTRGQRSPALAPIFLVHGTMDHSGSFRALAQQLTDRTVVGYDRRGWGRSRPLWHKSLVLEDHVTDLVNILASDACAENNSTAPTVVGHSYGALVALCAAARASELVGRLVVFEPTITWLPWWPREAPWERMVRDSANDPKEAASRLIDAVAGMRVAHRRDTADLTSDGRALVAEMLDPTINSPTFDPIAIDTATTVIAGERSAAHHVELSRRLAEILPNGRFVEIPGCGHAAHITHPTEFAKLIENA